MEHHTDPNQVSICSTVSSLASPPHKGEGDPHPSLIPARCKKLAPGRATASPPPLWGRDRVGGNLRTPMQNAIIASVAVIAANLATHPTSAAVRRCGDFIAAAGEDRASDKRPWPPGSKALPNLAQPSAPGVSPSTKACRARSCRTAHIAAKRSQSPAASRKPPTANPREHCRKSPPHRRKSSGSSPRTP
jgi:hypothetical protein